MFFPLMRTWRTSLEDEKKRRSEADRSIMVVSGVHTRMRVGGFWRTGWSPIPNFAFGKYPRKRASRCEAVERFCSGDATCQKWGHSRPVGERRNVGASQREAGYRSKQNPPLRPNGLHLSAHGSKRWISLWLRTFSYSKNKLTALVKLLDPASSRCQAWKL